MRVEKLGEREKMVRKVRRLAGGGAVTVNKGRVTATFTATASAMISSSPAIVADCVQRGGRTLVEPRGCCQVGLLFGKGLGI